MSYPSDPDTSRQKRLPRQGQFISDTLGTFRPKRLAIFAVVALLALLQNEIGILTREMLVDAYVQVSSFVAATLLLFYGAEKLFRFNIAVVLSNWPRAQIPLAALLGSTPGCGGAVVVVAAYSSGHVGFGAVVATLTATMGDAAFLLIATRPDVAAVVLPVSFIVGIGSGFLTDLLIKVEFRAKTLASCEIAPRIDHTRFKDVLFLLIAAPGLVLGVSQIFQVDLDLAFGSLVPIIGLTGSFLGMFIWATSNLNAMTHADDSPLTRMAEETSFISVWVIGAYLSYEYAVAVFGLDLEAAFASVAILLPLLGVLVGFVPGCGPQVLVTTLYINGVVPFATLIGNAISNDGDALFPAIALNPKAAVFATLVSGIPGLLVAYGFFFLAPGFL